MGILVGCCLFLVISVGVSSFWLNETGIQYIIELHLINNCTYLNYHAVMELKIGALIREQRSNCRTNRYDWYELLLFFVIFSIIKINVHNSCIEFAIHFNFFS